MRHNVWMPVLCMKTLAVVAYYLSTKPIDIDSATVAPRLRIARFNRAQVSFLLNASDLSDVFYRHDLLPLPHLCREGTLFFISTETDGYLPPDSVDGVDIVSHTHEYADVSQDEGVYGILQAEQDSQGYNGFFSPTLCYRIAVLDSDKNEHFLTIGLAQALRSLVPYGADIQFDFFSGYYANARLYNGKQVLLIPSPHFQPCVMRATLAYPNEDDPYYQNGNIGANTVWVHVFELHSDLRPKKTRENISPPATQ
eukprot:1945797-Rhodomonas_salina.1